MAKMEEGEEKYFFGYYRGMRGEICCQRWYGFTSQPNPIIESTRVVISQEEWEGPLSALEEAYPYKGGV